MQAVFDNKTGDLLDISAAAIVKVARGEEGDRLSAGLRTFGDVL